MSNSIDAVVRSGGVGVAVGIDVAFAAGVVIDVAPDAIGDATLDVSRCVSTGITVCDAAACGTSDAGVASMRGDTVVGCMRGAGSEVKDVGDGVGATDGRDVDADVDVDVDAAGAGINDDGMAVDPGDAGATGFGTACAASRGIGASRVSGMAVGTERTGGVVPAGSTSWWQRGHSSEAMSRVAISAIR